MEPERRSHLVLNSFWLKIIAMITMTFDHVGVVLASSGYAETWFVILYTVFRYIGRLSLPLYCFLITEGVIHTKKAWKYFLRLGIMAIAIGSVLIVAEYVPDLPSLRLQGNIFMDLLLGAVAVYCLKNKRWYVKVLAALPLAWGIASFFARGYENAGEGLVHIVPFFLRPQYDWFGILLIILFYVAYLLTDLFLKRHSEQSGLDVDVLRGTYLERNAANIICIGMLIFASLLYFLSSFIIPEDYVYWNPVIQNFAMVAGAFLLLYNGRRGYNAKWFQYGSYLFYPLHIAIIFGIGLLVMILI